MLISLSSDQLIICVTRSDGSTKKGHLMILTDASQDIWERKWFVLKR